MLPSVKKQDSSLQRLDAMNTSESVKKVEIATESSDSAKVPQKQKDILLNVKYDVKPSESVTHQSNSGNPTVTEKLVKKPDETVSKKKKRKQWLGISGYQKAGDDEKPVDAQESGAKDQKDDCFVKPVDNLELGQTGSLMNVDISTSGLPVEEMDLDQVSVKRATSDNAIHSNQDNPKETPVPSPAIQNYRDSMKHQPVAINDILDTASINDTVLKKDHGSLKRPLPDSTLQSSPAKRKLMLSDYENQMQKNEVTNALKTSNLENCHQRTQIAKSEEIPHDDIRPITPQKPQIVESRFGQLPTKGDDLKQAAFEPEGSKVGIKKIAQLPKTQDCTLNSSAAAPKIPAEESLKMDIGQNTPKNRTFGRPANQTALSPILSKSMFPKDNPVYLKNCLPLVSYRLPNSNAKYFVDLQIACLMGFKNSRKLYEDYPVLKKGSLVLTHAQKLTLEQTEFSPKVLASMIENGVNPKWLKTVDIGKEVGFALSTADLHFLKVSQVQSVNEINERVSSISKQSIAENMIDLAL